MTGKAIFTVDYVQFKSEDEENVKAMKALCGRSWYGNGEHLRLVNPKSGEITMVRDGEYVVRDVFGNIDVYSKADFQEKFTALMDPFRHDLSKWTVVGDPFQTEEIRETVSKAKDFRRFVQEELDIYGGDTEPVPKDPNRGVIVHKSIVDEAVNAMIKKDLPTPCISDRSELRM